MASTRKPLTAMLVQPSDDLPGTLVVICDDGAVFSYDWEADLWTPMAPVPATPAAREAAEREAAEREAAEREG
jgi:phage baseplate assembly protein gpV